MEEASQSFTVACSTLQLSIATASLAVNMQIDRDINVLLTAVDGMQVQLARVLEELAKTNQSHSSSPNSGNKKQLLTVNEESIINNGDMNSSSKSNESEDTMMLSDGRRMDSKLVKQMSHTLEQLEVLSTDVRKIQQNPIGTGGFSKVYMVEYKGKVRAAKVVQLTGLSMKLLQKVYVKFAKELYILSRLQSPRVVTLYGCVSSITEVSLILEYMHNGCLRSVMKNETDWLEL
jgi:hypothetical protein